MHKIGCEYYFPFSTRSKQNNFAITEDAQVYTHNSQ